MSKTYSFEQRFWRAMLYVASLLVVVFLIAPILIVIPLSFSGGSALRYPLEGFSLRWYAEILSTPVWQASLENSIIVASLTTVAATILGTMAAIGLSSLSLRSRLLKAVYGMLLLPMVVPLIIIALGIYFAFAYVGLLGTYLGLVTAHSFWRRRSCWSRCMRRFNALIGH
ncbi:ABC transporter permease [Mesorhizobium sp. ORM6]